MHPRQYAPSYRWCMLSHIYWTASLYGKCLCWLIWLEFAQTEVKLKALSWIPDFVPVSSCAGPHWQHTCQLFMLLVCGILSHQHGCPSPGYGNAVINQQLNKTTYSVWTYLHEWKTSFLSHSSHRATLLLAVVVGFTYICLWHSMNCTSQASNELLHGNNQS